MLLAQTETLKSTIELHDEGASYVVKAINCRTGMYHYEAYCDSRGDAYATFKLMACRILENEEDDHAVNP